jgi:hypothetical protein
MDLVPLSDFARLGALWLPPWAVRPADPASPATIRMVDGRRMQCKDIPDEVFLDAVRRTAGVGGSFAPEAWRMRWHVEAELEKETGPIPERLLLAKAKKLTLRGLLGGCYCGCRGDYHIATECPYESCCHQAERSARGAGPY